MKRLVITILAGILVLAGSCHAGGLIAAYNFASTVPQNLVTGHTGGTWQAVATNASNPHGIAGYSSLQVGLADGTSGSASLPADQNLLTQNSTHNFTIDFWVRPTPEIIANSGMLMSVGDNTYGVRLGIDSNGKLVHCINAWSRGVSSATLAANQWYHIAYQFRWTDSNQGWTYIYINGLLDTQVWDAGYDQTSGNSGLIGYSDGYGELPGVTHPSAYGSLFDDLRVYNTAVSQDQIVSDMNTPIPEPQGTMTTLPIAAYDFSNVVPENVITGHTGGTWNWVGTSSDNPHGASGNGSAWVGLTDGQPGSLSLPADQDLWTNNPTRNFTIDFWVKPTAELISNSGALMSIGNNAWGIRMGVNANGKLVHCINPWSNGVSNTTLVANQWYHVAYQFEWTDHNLGWTNIYINGVLDTRTWDFGYDQNSGIAGMLGYSDGYNELPGVTHASAYGSLFDDLRVYNTVISPDQIRYDMFHSVPSKPNPGGNRPPFIYDSHAVTVDGDLSDWTGTFWAPLDQLYDQSDPYDITEAYYAARWDSVTNKLYVAVKVNDTMHKFTDTFTSWSAHDSVEIYVHTNGMNGDYANRQEPAQQYVLGFKTDGATLWSAMGDGLAVPASAGFQYAGRMDGDWLNYEAAITPYTYFGGISGDSSIVTILKPGDIIGLDVCAVGNNGSQYTGVLSENEATGKSGNYSAIATHELVGKMSGLKTSGDGTNTFFEGIVTAATSNYIYMENKDRTAGLRVNTPGTGIAIGSGVLASGTLGTLDSGERSLMSYVSLYLTSDPVLPLAALGMTNKSLGGGDWMYDPAAGSGQKGVLDGSGLNNIGLYVKTTGIVTQVDPNYKWFCIDDGSGVNLKCIDSTQTGNVPDSGMYVIVDGISSCEKIGNDPVRVLLATDWH